MLLRSLLDRAGLQKWHDPGMSGGSVRGIKAARKLDLHLSILMAVNALCRSTHTTKDVDRAGVQREAIKLMKGTESMSWEEDWGQGREKSPHMVEPLKDLRGSTSGSCLCLHGGNVLATGVRLQLRVADTQLKYVLDKEPVRNITQAVYHFGGRGASCYRAPIWWRFSGESR